MKTEKRNMTAEELRQLAEVVRQLVTVSENVRAAGEAETVHALLRDRETALEEIGNGTETEKLDRIGRDVSRISYAVRIIGGLLGSIRNGDDKEREFFEDELRGLYYGHLEEDPDGIGTAAGEKKSSPVVTVGYQEGNKYKWIALPADMLEGFRKARAGHGTETE